MSILKNEEIQIEDFKFNQFSEKNAKESGVENFEFQRINPESTPNFIDKEIIREQRVQASKSDFKVDSFVKDYRGFSQQEEEDFQRRLQGALQERYDEVSQKAYQEGLELGKVEGEKLAIAQSKERIDKNLDDIALILESIQKQKDELLAKHKEDIYMMVKNISKWVALKEIKDDESSYLEKLLIKLISQINTKNSLNIKVSKDTYEQMESIVSVVEKRLGQLPNLRYEVSPEIESRGIVLESENGVIDASLEAQFANIDSIFKEVD